MSLKGDQRAMNISYFTTVLNTWLPRIRKSQIASLDYFNFGNYSLQIDWESLLIWIRRGDWATSLISILK